MSTKSGLHRHSRLLAAAAATSIAVTGAVIGASAVSAAPQGGLGTEHIQVMSTSATGGPASVIARGAFTAAGEARIGSAKEVTIVFPGGTVRLSHQAGRGNAQVDPRTCLDLITQPGTYQIVGGTGRYAGIRGSGTYELTLEFIDARAHGRCTSGQAPVAQQELLRLDGRVRL